MDDPRHTTERKPEKRRAQKAKLEELPAIVTFYSHGRANMVAMHPCDTFRFVADEADARCHGCERVERLNKYAILSGRGAHLPWPTVMAGIVCTHCGGRPSEIRFLKDGRFTGAVSIEPKLTYHGPPGSDQRSHLVESLGMPDPEAQHDDGVAL